MTYLMRIDLLNYGSLNISLQTVDINKTILAAFITRLVRHPEKQK